MEYTYLGDKLTRDDLKNKRCCAVRRPNGKCIRAKSKMLVDFGNNRQLVIAYRLRKIT